jgi:hypothetical protein
VHFKTSLDQGEAIMGVKHHPPEKQDHFLPSVLVKCGEGFDFVREENCGS